MELSPQTIRSTGFRTVKKGYDPTEVDSFKEQVASIVESAQNQATAMEARARAAVAKLQEVSQQVGGQATERPATPVAAAALGASSASGDTEMISRTLLLAQRTADATVAEARTEADFVLAQAREEAGRVLDSARTMAAKTVEDAKADARRSADDERVRADNEVQALLARRDFLLSDVDHLEQYIQAQRERLRDAAVQIQELVERVPGGLGDMRRPLLSASADSLPGSLQPLLPTSAVVADAAPASAPVAPAAEPVAPATLPSAEPVGGASLLADLAATAPESEPSAAEQVWRLLDAETAGSAQPSFDGLSTEVTAEVPAQPATPVARPDDPFRISGDELR